MGHDAFGPFAPARVNVQVIPAGRISKSRYSTILRALQNLEPIPLKRISENQLGISGAAHTTSKPSAGELFYDFSVPQPEAAKVEAFPFELNRAPQILLALSDGRELRFIAERDNRHSEADALDPLVEAFDKIRVTYASTWLQILFIYEGASFSSNREDVICGTDSVEAAILKVSRLFLQQAQEISHLTQGALVHSPRQASNPGVLADRTKPPLVSHSPGEGTKSVTVSRDMHLATPRQDQGRLEDRDSSTDRVEPAPRDDVEANRAQGRKHIVKGEFQLQCGDLLSALSELSQGASLSRADIDCFWHARALECLLVCMLLLSRSATGFEIPEVCLAQRRSTFVKQTHSIPNSASDSHDQGQSLSVDKWTANIQFLFQVLPEIIHRTFGLLSSDSSLSKEPLPPILVCEQMIRLTRMLISIGTLKSPVEASAIDALVLGSRTFPSSPVSLIDSSHRSASIASQLILALMNQQPYLSSSETIYVLTGLSTCLSQMRLERKQAFYLHELLQKLVPSLVEARKIGAAEMGIHPAAGLSQLDLVDSASGGVMTHNLRGLLDNLVGSFGPHRGWSRSHQEPKADGTSTTLQAGNKSVSGRYGGDLFLKMESLRTCISVCNSLPDFAASLAFTTQLLRTSKQSLLLSPTPRNEASSLSSEEQNRLLNNIKRTVAAASKRGLSELRADYWDDFLVRKINLIGVQNNSRLSLHSSKELSLAASPRQENSKDPFIFKSFSGTRASPGNDVVVVGETADFTISLQNMFQFEVEIDQISLLTEGCDFEPASQSIVLRQSCIQDLIVSGTPRQSGQLRILGCRARIRDCYERDFHIYQGLLSSSLRTRATAGTKNSGFSRQDIDARMPAQADQLSITVIPQQPYVSFASTKPLQPSLMLLEGENRSFEITLKNESKTMPVDLLLFAFEDSVTKQLHSALENKDLSPAEVYELSDQLRKPVIWLRPSQGVNGTPQLLPNASETFIFEVYGKPGLTYAIVQIDYAHLGVPREDLKGEFYTRQLTHPVALTVNGSVEIPRFNIFPLSDNFLPLRTSLTTSNPLAIESEEQFDDAACPETDENEGVCLVVLDLRNVWPHPLLVNIKQSDGYPPKNKEVAWMQRFSAVSELLQPGHISRVVLMRPRIFLQNPQAAVPIIENQRQFVVSSSQMSLEAELAAREAFWCREEILKGLNGRWKEMDSGREGDIDFRKAVRLSPRMIEIVQNPLVEVDFQIKPAQEQDRHESHPTSSCISQISKSHFIVHTEMFATLVIRVHNRSKESLKLVLRLQPVLRNQPHNIALDLFKRFVWSGVLQRALRPPIESGSVREATLGITALAEGEYAIHAFVEELEARHNANPLLPANPDETGPVASRRIWHAREPCLIDAVFARDEQK